jgi:hypothetical protein
MAMVSSIRNAALLGALAVTCVGFGATPAAAAEPSQPLTLRGVVERLPGTPDSRGEWRIGGLAVMVGPQTRLEEDIANVRNEGYWTQVGTGVVVWAPGWLPESAHSAGFRPALRKEVGGIGLGRLVEAKVWPAVGGVLHALEIVLHDRSGGPAPR